MSEEINEIYGRLLARDYALTLFGDLGQAKKSGRGYMALCPFHEDKSPSFSFSTEKPLFHCFSCGKSGDWLTYIMERESLDFKEALDRLAKEAGVELRGHDREAWERERGRADILERALEFFRGALWKDGGKETLAYYKGRGYSEAEIKNMELGYYPGKAETGKFLKGLDAKQAKDAFKYLDWRDDYKALIPYRDPLGNIKSLWGRLTRPLKTGETEADKYKPLTEAEGAKATPFSMDRARRSGALREKGELVIVEGYFDALAVREKAGVENVIALGGSALQERQLETALKYGAKVFILALDNDAGGITGTERALGLLQERGLRAYVLTLPAGNDPDGLIKAKGPGAFTELLRNPQSGARWKAGRILAKHDIQTDKGRDLALDEALAYEDGLTDPIESDYFLDEITRGLGITLEHLEHRLKTYKEKRARTELRKGYQALLKEGSDMLQEGRLEDLRETLERKAGELRAQAVTKRPEPYTLEKFLADIRQARPGLKTGYKSLDEIFLIPQDAITIIAGRPAHGKTTLLMNLLLSMAKAYPERSFLFYSYEESRTEIVKKLLNILSGEIIDKSFNLTQLEAYLKGGHTDRLGIETGKLKYKDLTESGRVWIIDEPLFVDELMDSLAYFRERRDIGAVFIDYIQKIKIKGRYATRQLELQKVSERILEAAKGLSVPIIMGAQLGRDKERSDKVRLDNLREAGDIEQDANLVLGLYNPAMEKAQDEGGTIAGDEVELKVTVLKNRNGPVNYERTLIFNRPLWTIKDKGGPW